jgi:L-threonylcarbamoyladenylate synthase
MYTIKADASGIKEAARTIANGGVVAYPTETFYGLGARYDDESALLKLFSIKGRPAEKPFSLIVPDIESARLIVESIPDEAMRLMKKYWPGPLTLVLKACEGVSKLIAPRGTVALRQPGESAALLLARELGFAMTASSANIAGGTPACSAREVAESGLTGLDLILDGGVAPGGLASTIIDFTGINCTGIDLTGIDLAGESPKILRQGAIRIL